MLRRVGHLLVILALLAATGTHWAVLQSVAWTAMLRDNLRTESFETALQRTFDGKHPCALCKKIASGKQTEKKSVVQNETRKLEFSYVKGTFVFASPSDFRCLANWMNLIHR